MIAREINLFVEEGSCALGAKRQWSSLVSSGKREAECSWREDQGVVLTCMKEAQSE
jgi:hypothetical protein